MTTCRVVQAIEARILQTHLTCPTHPIARTRTVRERAFPLAPA